MSKVEAFRAKLEASKAAKLGLTLEAFRALVAAEQAKLDAITLIRSDRTLARAILARGVVSRGNLYTMIGGA
jgi:hypothetical protein